MANEDADELLDLADSWKRGVRSGGRSTGKLIDQLAAEVRELRKDKARLDWMQEQCGEGILLHNTRPGVEVVWSGMGLGLLGARRTLRNAIDDCLGFAAMVGEG
jgi:hypothetical protein